MTDEQIKLKAEWNRLSEKALVCGKIEDMKALAEIDRQCREAQVPGFYAR